MYFDKKIFLTKFSFGVKIFLQVIPAVIYERRKYTMDAINAFLEIIDFGAIMTAITDFLAKINLQEILDKIIEFVSGLVAA